MSMKKMTNNKRLLEALDHVDERYVAELVKELKLPNEENGPITRKKAFTRSLRYAALVAACALLLGAVIPVVGFLVKNISNFAPAGNQGDGEGENSAEIAQTNTESPEEQQQLLQQTGAAFDGSPLFRIVNTDGDVHSRCEAFTADGEMIDLCICNSTPCTCTTNIQMMIYGDMICVIEEIGVDKITFLAFDISDRNNVRHTRISVGGLCMDTHEIWAMPGTPYYCAYQQISAQKDVIEELIVFDMSDAINGNIVRRNYPSFKYSVRNIDGITDILHIDGESVYFGIKDKKTNGIVNIVRALPEEKTATDLFNVTNTWHFGIRTDFLLEDDGTIHFLREEMDDLSEYGYSLYQYTWREGENVEKVLRAVNICDYVLSDGYIYYVINDPANSRKFKNYDYKSLMGSIENKDYYYDYDTYTDMTGGVIYRLPVNDLGYEPMAAWTLGEEYYLYGSTEKNKLFGTAHSHQPIFIQGPDGGIALWANKQVGENYMHVNLLIGDSARGIVMTELAGCYYWGYYGVSEVGGGTNINWDYRP